MAAGERPGRRGFFILETAGNFDKGVKMRRIVRTGLAIAALFFGACTFFVFDDDDCHDDDCDDDDSITITIHQSPVGATSKP